MEITRLAGSLLVLMLTACHGAGQTKTGYLIPIGALGLLHKLL